MSKKRWLPKGFICVWKVKKGYSLEWGETTNLIYNTETGIIYIYFADKDGKRRSICPYYGKHGKPCTIDENMKIVEVD